MAQMLEREPPVAVARATVGSTVGKWAADTWVLEIANPSGLASPGGAHLSSLPWPLCTTPSSDAGAAAEGPQHSIIKTSVSLMKSYPLLGRGETQVIMNQFSSGQPSAWASRGGSQIKARRGRLLSPPSPAFWQEHGQEGTPAAHQAGTLDNEQPEVGRVEEWVGRGASCKPGLMPVVSPTPTPPPPTPPSQLPPSVAPEGKGQV